MNQIHRLGLGAKAVDDSSSEAGADSASASESNSNEYLNHRIKRLHRQRFDG